MDVNKCTMKKGEKEASVIEFFYSVKLQLQQRSVKRTNFVEPGYNYLTCHNNFPFNSQSIKVYFSHFSNTVLSKLPG